MEEEMVTLHNVMPVELALLREKEYRRKMEASKNTQLNNLNPLLPSPVPNHPVNHTPFVSHTPLKRKEASSSSGHRALKRRSIGLVCKICDVTFNAINQMKDHLNSVRHKNSVQQLKKRGKNVSTPFLCELCNSSCSSDIVMEDHLKGTKHVSLLQEFEKAKRARGMGFPSRMH